MLYFPKNNLFIKSYILWSKNKFEVRHKLVRSSENFRRVMTGFDDEFSSSDDEFIRNFKIAGGTQCLGRK
jgi:hypothetical protein